MSGPFQEALTAVQSVGRWFYVIVGLMWLAALVFAGIRVYQIWRQVLVPAVVVDSRLIAHYEPSHDTGADGFTSETSTLSYYREATVRYEVDGKPVSAEIGKSGSGFRWIEERLLREWKPGARIRVRLDPARPDKPMPALGFNYATFDATFGLLFGGLCFAGFGYGIVRAIEFVLRSMDAHMPTRGQ